MEIKHKIVIVDDHDMFRKGVKALLKKCSHIEFIGEAANGVDFLKLIATNQPDVVLMDISMPEMNGIEATRQALLLNPNLKILALSMFGDEEYYYKMIQAGVKGFIIKSSGINELEYAIEEVAKGSSFFSPELLSYVLIHANDTNSEDSSLTDLEINVIKGFAKNMTDEKIAEQFSMDIPSIETIRKELLIKTESTNTAGLVMYAIKNKIISV
jgi:DNA-binding NarL/FixJ family response regulator